MKKLIILSALFIVGLTAVKAQQYTSCVATDDGDCTTKTAGAACDANKTCEVNAVTEKCACQ